MLLEQPPPLLLNDDLALRFLLMEFLLLPGLLPALQLVHLASQLDEPLGLALVLLDLHAPLLLVHLLYAVVLGKLPQQLLADLLLLLPSCCGLLLFHLHLESVGVLHLLPVLQLLTHLDLLATPCFGLELLQMQVVPEQFQLLRLFVLGLHLANHSIKDLELFTLGLRLFLRQPLLTLALLAGVGLNPVVLFDLGLLHGLLLDFLLRHKLLQDLACLLLLVQPGMSFVRVLLRNLFDQLLDLVFLLQVLCHGFLPLRLLHGNLLLVDVLDTLPLLALLDAELVLEFHVFKSFIRHVLCYLLFQQSILFILHADLNQLLRPLLIHLRHVKAFLQRTQLLAAVADAPPVHLFAQLHRLSARKFVREVLLELGDLAAARLVLLAPDVGVVGEELAALGRGRAGAPLFLHAHLAPAVARQDVVLRELPPDLPVPGLLLPPLLNPLLHVGSRARHPCSMAWKTQFAEPFLPERSGI
mmetsp:Transcript_106785/g.334034  ORF Transcript_106785/g.334034 Transcript_106785/m.334034 type:complete len:471 (+) Transcript_106785:462-1874(+)